MAAELGLFKKFDLRVRLTREVGWATIRDKVIYRELDAAHALAPMVFAASLGLGAAQADCLTGLVLSLNGNAITVNSTLWDAATSRIAAGSRLEPLVFGIPFLYSSHHFLLRAWLRSQGLVPGRDVRFVIVPPPQMPANLKSGHLDGYCVGEPWNSVAVLSGLGTIAATSLEIAPQHPEKILLVRREFAEARAEEHECLIAALLESCRFCAVPANHPLIIETLALPQYLNVPASTLRICFDGCPSREAFVTAAHEPSHEQAAWVLEQMSESGLLPDRTVFRSAAAARVFRADIFHDAIKSQPRHERNETNPPFHAAH